MNTEKISSILELVVKYLLPLAEQGVKITKNIEDDLIVALLKGGIPAVEQKLKEYGQNSNDG